MARGRADGRRIVDLSSSIDQATTDRTSGRRALFASGIPIGATEDELRGFFEGFGTVENLKLRADNRERQLFAIIVFQFAADAKKALMQGVEYKGRRLMVAFAR